MLLLCCFLIGACEFLNLVLIFKSYYKMKNFGLKNAAADLASIGLEHLGNAYWNLSPSELIERTLALGEGTLANNGALVIKTGEFTGRAPEDRFIVKDDTTAATIDWGKVNIAFEPARFDALYQKVASFLQGKDVFVRDANVCADPTYRLSLRLVGQKPWSGLFAHNMFMRLTPEEILAAQPDWTIVCAPEFKANPAIDGTRSANFVVVNFSKKIVLIGGTGYTGEIKKSIFSILNYILPHERNVLSMHCSANIGKNGDTAVFFGLSGTGKTTLSADPNRNLIGDDEHGWSDKGIFNFEGGCYAKTINLSKESEPEIYNAIRFGALVENTGYIAGTRQIDFADKSITENTRVSYPLDFIDNAVFPSVGGTPTNIFFLTCDAFGVLPPIARLTPGQAMYHFISGYTAKVAGTEAGITEPKKTFSACFGAPFLPLHPTRYAEMLGERMKKNNVNIWLVNTGWSGGSYGTGKRMAIKYTRALITAALEGRLANAEFQTLPFFGLQTPVACEGVPADILNPRNTWADKAAYDHKAQELANDFVKNFEKYKAQANEEILAAAPTATTAVV
jgi:phosphoenolpyruvate carboxykinase (ATP)